MMSGLDQKKIDDTISHWIEFEGKNRRFAHDLIQYRHGSMNTANVSLDDLRLIPVQYWLEKSSYYHPKDGLESQEVTFILLADKIKNIYGEEGQNFIKSLVSSLNHQQLMANNHELYEWVIQHGYINRLAFNTHANSDKSWLRDPAARQLYCDYLMRKDKDLSMLDQLDPADRAKFTKSDKQGLAQDRARTAYPRRHTTLAMTPG